MKKIFVLFISCFIYGYGFAQITDSVSFSLPQIEVSTQGTYATLAFENCSFIKEVGAPRLPYLKFYYVIPIGKRVSHISLSDTVFVSQVLSKTVYPVQPEYPINESPPTFVVPNQNYYNTVFPNQNIEIGSHSFMKGYHIVVIDIYPIQYNGTTNTIRFATSMKFTLHLEDDDIQPILPKRQSVAMKELVKNQIQSMVRNSEQIDENFGTLPMSIIPLEKYVQNTIPEYLIITNNTYLTGEAIPKHNGKSMTETFQELADWKTQKGIPTVIVTLDEIVSTTEGYDTEEKIHNYLEYIYEEEYGTVFVLFGGDISVIPSRFAGGLYTDLYFTAIANNWNANGNDIWGESMDWTDYTSYFYYGRALVSNGTEAQVFVNKVLEYEKMTNISNKNYVNNALFVAGCLTLNDATVSKVDNVVKGIKQSNINKWKLYDNTGDQTLNKTNFINNLNIGQNFGKFHLVYHSDHAGYNSMGTSWTIQRESVKSGDMDKLINNNYYQILYTNGCNPGEFDKDCIIKHYLNNSNGGGVASIASSAKSWDGEESFFQNFVNQIYPALGNPTLYKIGVVHDKSIVSDFDGGFGKCKNHLFGDPEMPIWTRTPSQLSVSNTTSVSNINNQIVVTVSNLIYSQDLVVCLLKDNEIYERLYDGVNTQPNTKKYTFNIEPQTAGNITLTITGHNYLPFQTTIPVAITGKNVYIHSTEIFESGWGNQKIDAGETIDMNIRLRNNGTVNLSNVSATLTCLSNNVTMLTSTCSFVNIYANSITTKNLFQFKVNDDIGDGEVLNFKLTITDDNGYSVERFFQYQAYASDLKIEQIHSSLNGNIYELFVDVYNAGGDARSVTAAISSPNISIATTYSHYGTIATHSLAQNVNAFEIPDSYTNEMLELTLTDFYGRTTSIIFYIIPPESTVENIKYTSTDKSIKLTWNPKDPEWAIPMWIFQYCKGYNIYRSNAVNGNFIKLNNRPLAATVSAYNDVGLDPYSRYYYKISWVNDFGIESQLSEVCEAWTTLPYLSGYPIAIPDYLGRTFAGSPTAMDVNNDGYKEIFFTSYSEEDCGTLFAFDRNGKELYDIDNNPHTVSGFVHLQGEMLATPALADIDNDGKIEVVFSTRRYVSKPPLPDGGKVFAYKTTGDANGDGKPDICWSESVGENMLGVILAPFKSNAATIESFVPIAAYQTPFPLLSNNGIQYGNFAHYISWDNTRYMEQIYYTAAVADIDNEDGHQEIVYNTLKGVFVYRKNSSGNYILNWSRTTTLLSGYEYTNIPAVLVDLDGDGKMEIVFPIKAVNNNKFIICALRHDNTFLLGWEPNTNRSIIGADDASFKLSHLAVGDVNNDGHPEIVIVSSDRYNSYDYSSLCVFNHTGSIFSNFPKQIANIKERTNPLLADVDGNCDIEIIIAGKDNKIYAYKMDGSLVFGFPLESGGDVTPCIADINYDGKSDIIGLGNGKVYVWKTEGDARKIEWGHRRYNERNTGAYKSKKECPYNNTPYQVSGQEEWNSFKRVNQNVEIPNNATLTIRGEIQFSADASITVQPGGKLIVNGGTLTNACDGELWVGIRIEGNGKVSQTAINQGTVELKNNARIENAIVGVYVYPHGILKANNTHFLNNMTAVFFSCWNHGPVHADILTNNVSKLDNCEFTLNNNAFFHKAYRAQVELVEVHGVSFTNCTFADNRTKNAASNYITGIFANGSSLKIGTLNKGCSFSGFNKAIELISSSQPSSIHSCTFNNNDIAIDALQTRDLTVENCHFTIPSIVYSSNYNLYGISLDKSSGYNIVNNYFTGMGGTGIYVNQSGIGNHFIKNNTFNNLCVGCLANGNNGNGDGSWEWIWDEKSYSPVLKFIPMQGVVFRCNSFYKNYRDIEVAENSKIRKKQAGTFDYATGNTFLQSDYNIYNKGDKFEYYYLLPNNSVHFPSLVSYPSSSSEVTIKGKGLRCCEYSGYVGNAYYEEDPSAVYYCTPPSSQQWDVMTNLDYTYLKAEDMYDVKVTDYKNKSYHLTTINWDAPAVVTIVSGLEFLPDGLTVVINGMSPTTSLEEQVAMYYEMTNAKEQMDMACYAAIDFLAKDTAGLDINAYRLWLSRFNTIESDYALADNYISTKEFAQAGTILNTMPLKFPYLDMGTHQNYLDYVVAAQTIDSLLHEDYTLSPSFIGNVITYFQQNNLLPPFLLDNLVECFAEQLTIPSYLIETLTDIFKNKGEFFPFWKQQATQYLTVTATLTDNVINELFDNFAYTSIVSRYIIEDKNLYPYWQDGFAQYLETQGLQSTEIDNIIAYYQTMPFPPLFVDTLVDYFNANLPSDYWKNVLYNYVSASKQIPVSLANNFVISMGTGGEFPYNLMYELVSNVLPIELSPMLSSLASLPLMNEPLNFLYDNSVCLIEKMGNSSDFLPALLVYAKENPTFPSILKDELFHSFGIDIIPIYLKNELWRLSENKDRAGLKSYSLLGGIGEMDAEAVMAGLENWHTKPYIMNCVVVNNGLFVENTPINNSIPNQDEQTPEKPILSIAEKGEIIVKPNPTTGQLTITNYEFQENDVIEVYSVMGQKLQSKIVNRQPEIVIDVSHLANGMYYLRVGNKVVKFVKN